MKIARQQKMVAVVDHEIGGGVIVGARASARLLHRLMHDDTLAALAQADRGGKTGQPGSDDMNGARHQMNA